MKFKIITEKGTEIEMESNQEIGIILDDKKFIISIKEDGNI